MPVGCRLAILVSVLLPIGCNKSAADGPSTGPNATGFVAVKVTSPKRQSLRWSVEQPGTVTAYEVTPIAAKLAGYVKEIAPDTAARQRGIENAVIDIGSVIKKDQLLATLDIPELVEEATLKRAGLGQARAELELVRKDLAVTDAWVTAARAAIKEAEAGVTKAQAELARWKTELTQADELVERKVIDVQSRAVVFKQYEAADAAKAEAVAHVTTAAANLTERQARRDKVDADILAAEARVKVAEAAVREVDARVSYTRVTAPYDGVVTDRRVHTGHFTQPTPGMAGHVLFMVARLDLVRVAVDMPETSAAKAVPGAKAVIRIPALNNEEFPGTVTRTAGVVQPDTRTMRAEIDLLNDKRLIQPGMYAFVRIEAEPVDAVVLPVGCVLPADETHYVYLVEGDKAVKYRVRVGRTDGSMMQILGRRRATATNGDWMPFTGNERAVNGNLGAITDGVEVTATQ